MCGICGVVALGRPPEAETVERMAAELDHRGPDGPGSYNADGVALGFRRLAIIDLSDAGDQPFASEDGALQLVHNGEVYNYRELRRELEAEGHRFRSATDTEVILAAYREWGERCVERFNGMWAFALWDGPRRRLFASRDQVVVHRAAVEAVRVVEPRGLREAAVVEVVRSDQVPHDPGQGERQVRDGERDDEHAQERDERAVEEAWRDAHLIAVGVAGERLERSSPRRAGARQP